MYLLRKLKLFYDWKYNCAKHNTQYNCVFSFIALFIFWVWVRSLSHKLTYPGLDNGQSPGIIHTRIYSLVGNLEQRIQLQIWGGKAKYPGGNPQTRGECAKLYTYSILSSGSKRGLLRCEAAVLPAVPPCRLSQIWSSKCHSLYVLFILG